MKRLRIGSRGSALALWQAHYIARRLHELGVATEIEIIKTSGDRLATASLIQAGGKGLFTKEIEDALLAGEIDLAVHSLKDLPTVLPQGLLLAAIPEREDPHDVLVGSTLAALPKGARVGTSSLRRGAQLRLIRPDLKTEPIRGNVDTRLRKQKEGQFDAIVLAAAGLRRLGLEAEIAEVLTPEQVCPAAGQGALAIETREEGIAREICAKLDHEPTRRAVDCERALLLALGGGCQVPIGAFAEVQGGGLHLRAVVVMPDASRQVRGTRSGKMEEAEAVGKRLANELLEQGAAEILQSLPEILTAERD